MSASGTCDRGSPDQSGVAIGLDLGTTAVKAVVVSALGETMGRGTAPLELITGPGGLVEQDPEAIWRCAREALREALSGCRATGAPAAMGLSSQGGTLILADGKGHLFGNAISWMDSRPARLGEEILKGRDDTFFYQKTGWGLRLGALPLAQLLRLKAQDPRVLTQARRLHFVDSYVMERLTGRSASDPSDAAITMLYNVRDDRWDDELLALAGIKQSMLPAVSPSRTSVGAVCPEAARELGLPPNTLAVTGAHDQYCAALGAGCRRPGDTVVSCGTAWVVLTMTAEPRFGAGPGLAPARSATPGVWGLLGSCPAVGASADWFRKVVRPDGEALSFAELEAGTAATPAGADGVLFVPPGLDSATGGRFSGLAIRHRFGHLARAVMEGAVMSVCGLLDRMAAAGAAPAVLKVVGGAARSGLWMQMLADVTGLPVDIAGAQEAAAFGAAMLAGEAAGIISPDTCWQEPLAHIEPRSELRSTYDALLERFRREGDPDACAH